MESDHRNNETSLPLVSLICLTRNHEKFIAEAVSSLISQTYANLEIIFIDNASTDQTLAIGSSLLQASNRRYNIIANYENSNSSKGFNQGFRLSAGKCISIISGDDRMRADKVAVQVEMAEAQDETCIVFSDYSNMDVAGKALKGPPYRFESNKKIYPLRRLVISCCVCAPTVLIPRECFERVGLFDEALDSEDHEMWMRLAQKYPFIFVDKQLCDIRIVPSSSSRSRPRDKALRIHVLARASALGHDFVTSALVFLTIGVALFQLRKLKSPYYAETRSGIAARYSAKVRPLIYCVLDLISCFPVYAAGRAGRPAVNGLLHLLGQRV